MSKMSLKTFPPLTATYSLGFTVHADNVTHSRFTVLFGNTLSNNNLSLSTS